jgi:phosphohistidine phosphatase SixA
MKRLLLLFFAVFFAFQNPLCAQVISKHVPDGIYYLVRHAEKDSGADPSLTNAGYLRAGDLYRKLKDKKISRIYVNQYKRIQLTADSLRIYQKADTIHYVADASGDDLISRLINTNPVSKPNNVLIIGHSNTIPVIIKRLGITNFSPDEIPGDEFDNLYVIKRTHRQIMLDKMKYGTPTISNNKKEKMKRL